MGVNPVKRAHFRVIEAGIVVLDASAIMGVQIPGVEFTTDDHMEANHRRETPTSVNIPEFQIDLYEDNAQANNFWLDHLAYDQDTGALLDPAVYEYDMVIEQLGLDNLTPIRRFTCRQCWNKKSELEKSERKSNENQVRKITIKPVYLREESLL